jgi:glycosyltransferase involved in cell wall biosynthesis
MPIASIVVPSYNAQATLPETLASLRVQSFQDIEIIIVNDGSTDDTARIAEAASAADPRIRVVTQLNRGLAGARNSGIAAARGEFVGFCDADDLWHPGKMAAHVAHLRQATDVGLSYAGSRLIDMQSQPIGAVQKPRLSGVTAAHILKRNPIGNGSAPVMRREALQALAYRPRTEMERDWVFDETFRQSEDIECWLRLALTTDWRIEGVEGFLTDYRLSPGGLSAATDRQLASWERMIEKLMPLSPNFFARHLGAARAYQLRYLARRAISDLDGPRAMRLVRQSLAQSVTPLVEEPVKTGITMIAALVLLGGGAAALKFAMRGKASSPKTSA